MLMLVIVVLCECSRLDSRVEWMVMRVVEVLRGGGWKSEVFGCVVVPVAFVATSWVVELAFLLLHDTQGGPQRLLGVVCK